MIAGEHLTLRIEKPAVGGRMIARHGGAVVLVSGTIPGEVVEAAVEKVQRGTVWARAVRVIEASPDRLEATTDWMCGGNVFAHIAYDRQVALKREIIGDAFARIARLPLPGDVPITGSPQAGYRMRARLHCAQGRLGFFKEGTHELCEPATTGQLLPDSVATIEALQATIPARAADQVLEVALAENCAATARAVHLVLTDDADPARLAGVGQDLDVCGVSCGRVRGGRPLVLRGAPEVTDILTVSAPSGPYDVTLTRQASAFFQANRFLLQPLVQAVVDAVPAGRALDLYAGVGLFSVSLVARRDTDVVAIEGDRTTSRDLKFNASRVGGVIETRHEAVEQFLASRRVPELDAVIVDPPRTGMTKDALRGTIALRASRVVYVSCDVATLARDARALADAGYGIASVRAFDLFPRTAHVETLAVFDRR